MSSRPSRHTQIASAYKRGGRARPVRPVPDDGPGLDRILERELHRLLERARVPLPLPGSLQLSPATPTPMLPLGAAPLRLPSSFEAPVTEDLPTLPDPGALPWPPPCSGGWTREQVAVVLLSGLAAILGLLMQLGSAGGS